MSQNVVPPGVLEFRERLKRLSEPRSTIAERTKAFLAWLGSPVAWLALFISAATAYYNIFYYVDEVRVSIDELPMVFFNKEANVFMVTGPKSFAFVNTGTRAILIQKVELDFNQPLEKETARVPCKVGGIWRGLDLQFAPTVLKPGEISAVPVTSRLGNNLVYAPQVKFDELKQKHPYIDSVIDVQGNNASVQTSEMTLDSCLRFVIITPDGAMDQVRMHVANYTVNKSSPPQNSAGASYQFNPDSPVSLLRASSFRSKTE
ncbi:hypothetical protein P0R31_39640 [Bradyrhizobium yuanmingense]|uniref:hypothetical protein n=1 Tax=Bradyrhizobium yuanmingense TaxID=108015 RepID=UPI0023B956FE|nr:hypothetical protein [Bradyrhizobium yuanmingense]MDF0523307.1 hypothetical protein [Bradyrhizobium yuanmingense]